MGGTLAGYLSPVDFRISQFPPDLPDGGTGGTASLEELYNFAQQVIHAFISNCGIAQQQQITWPQLALNPASTMLSGNLNRLYIVASENILAFSAVNVWNNSGTLMVRNAKASTAGFYCDGFLTVNTGVISGEYCEVTLHSGVAQFTGLVGGQRYYLSTTPGLVAPFPALGAGQVEQYVGIALDTTHLAFNCHYWIQH